MPTGTAKGSPRSAPRKKPGDRVTTRRRKRQSPAPVPTQLPDEAAADAEFSRGRITVRMYRDILGDCFLLRFPSADGILHVLIDCGILQGMPGAHERANRIMANIGSVTRRLDILIATHEHVDHLSGFAQAREHFDGISVGELWLAWTENPRDELAENLRRGRKRAAALIGDSYAAVAPLLAKAVGADEDDEEEIPDALECLHGLMAFSGIEPGGVSVPADGTTAGILRHLREKAERVRYLRPGEPVLALGSSGVGVYVLGPPRDDAMIRRSNPSRKGREVYELRAEGFDDDVFLVAATARDGDLPKGNDELARLGMSLPFGIRNLVALDPRAERIGARVDAEAVKTFRSVYDDPNQTWRHIDTDWLGAVEQLALKLDSDTNNTSLALAFEIGSGPEGRVMLFPGDAQVGNWLSWDDHVWPPGASRGEPGAIDASRLLSRTVLYKVGHHGSHNATMRERGLERMTHPDLVAMIPVEQEFANGTKKWNMPFPSLLARLEERCAGRVVRADRGRDHLVEKAMCPIDEPGRLSPAEWDAFLADLREISDAAGPLALEYRIAATSSEQPDPAVRSA